MSDSHALRTTVVGGTIAALLASLLLEPVRAFLGSVWRLVTAAPSALWGLLTTSVPLWALVAVAGVVALVARQVRRRGLRPPPVIEVYDPATGTVGPPRVEDPELPPLPRLNELEDRVLRRLARADGEWLAIEELGTAKTKQLRIEQALERLNALGLVEETESNKFPEPLYGLTARGRDLVIARGDVK